MSIIAVITSKGGSGKSTICCNLGAAAAGKRRSVCGIDCDPRQASMQFWAKGLRVAHQPVVKVGDFDTVVALVAEAQREGFDFIIIDCPPGGGDIVRRIAGLAEHILIPVRPTAFDLHAVRHTVEILRTTVDESLPEELQARNVLAKAAVVLNAVPTRSTARIVSDAAGALDECGAGGLDIIGTLCERAAYATAIADGIGVTEDGRDPRAAEEILALYDALRVRERKRANAIRQLPKYKQLPKLDKKRGVR